MQKYMIINEDEKAFSLTFEDGRSIFNWVDFDSAWVRQLPQAQAEAEANQLRKQGFTCWVVEAE